MDLNRSHNYNSEIFKKPLVLAGFKTLTDYYKGNDCTYNANDLDGYFFEDKPAQTHFIEFQELIFRKLGKEFFPIYRMADGEFVFLQNLFRPSLSLKHKTINILKNIKRFLRPRGVYYGGAVRRSYKKELRNIFDPYYLRLVHGESYCSKELISLKNKYPEMLKKIAQKGLLAIHFLEERNEVGYSNFHDDVFNFLNQIKLRLNSDNYTHFYFIYALLNGPNFKKLYNNNRILIVTNYSEDKKNRIIQTLDDFGVSKVEFLLINETGSMFEELDQEYLKSLRGKIDLVLVGAGLGSCNILLQLAVLNTVCIDAGINIECLANPSLKTTRIFLKPYLEELS
jgi:hypothetical protein